MHYHGRMIFSSECIRNHLSAESCLDPLWSSQRSLDSLAWSGEGDLRDREGAQMYNRGKGKAGKRKGKESRGGKGTGLHTGTSFTHLQPWLSVLQGMISNYSHSYYGMRWSTRTFQSAARTSNGYLWYPTAEMVPFALFALYQSIKIWLMPC